MKRTKVLLTVMLITALTLIYPCQAYAAKTISNSIKAEFTVLKSIFYVTSADEFTSANGLAEEGDTIVVKDGSTISFSSEIVIKEAITLKAETKGGAVLNFITSPDAKLNLCHNAITLENLKLNKSTAGEIINLNCSDNIILKDNELTGSGENTGIKLGSKDYPPTDPSYAADNGGADNVKISGSSFKDVVNGVFIIGGNGITIESNTFINTGKGKEAGGAVAVNSDIDPLILGSILIKDNTADESALCYWSNTKMGDAGNITDPIWFDSKVTFVSNTITGEKLTASRPLLLTLKTGSVFEDVTAGDTKTITFNASKVSGNISLTGVQFTIKCTASTGVLSSLIMKYGSDTLSKNAEGMYIISAEPDIDGDYSVNVTISRKGTYMVEIAAQQP